MPSSLADIRRNAAANLARRFSGLSAEQIAQTLVAPFDFPIFYASLAAGKKHRHARWSLEFNLHRMLTTVENAEGTHLPACVKAATGHAAFLSAAVGRSKASLADVITFGANRSATVSDFPPHICRDVLASLGCSASSRVLDPCGGWGGRMLGASLVVDEYVCVEASSKTCGGLRRLAAEIAAINPAFRAEIIHGDFVTANIGDAKFDAAITSPPYFDTERYGGEYDSAAGRSLDEWIALFFRPMIAKTMAALRYGGKFALNVGGTKCDLVALTESIAAELGLRCERGKTISNNRARETMLVLSNSKFTRPNCRFGRR